MDSRALVPLTAGFLGPGAHVLTPDPAVMEGLSALPSELAISAGPWDIDGSDPVDGVWLLAGEVAAAGQRGPAVIDAAVRRTRPGGMVAVAATSTVFARLTGAVGAATLDAGRLEHMLTERGLQVQLLAAPGATARLAGRRWAGTDDLEADRTPGLLDAGPVVLAVARTAPSPAERSRAFFASIARKVVAASVLCRDDHGRVLIVFDIFKDAWTLPGGLVDAAESPAVAAVREAHEEGGIRVGLGALLGVFAHQWPDRLHLVYAATPEVVEPVPVPLHDHEIREARWVTMDEAMRLLGGDMPRKVTCCLEDPGATWCW